MFHLEIISTKYRKSGHFLKCKRVSVGDVDLDADNDGIVDVIEAGGTDADGNGILDGGVYGSNGYNNTVDPADAASPLLTAGLDGSDTDSRPEYSVGGASGAMADNDGDDVPNFLDVDADNDLEPQWSS